MMTSNQLTTFQRSTDYSKAVPSDIWTTIFAICRGAYIPISKVALTCRLFNLCVRPIRYKSLGLEPTDEPHRLLAFLGNKKRLRKCIQHMHIEGHRFLLDKKKYGSYLAIMSLTGSLTNLRSLELHSAWLYPASIFSLTGMPLLSHLELHYCQVVKGFISSRSNDFSSSIKSLTFAHQRYTHHEDLLEFLHMLGLGILSELIIGTEWEKTPYVETVLKTLKPRELIKLSLRHIPKDTHSLFNFLIRTPSLRHFHVNMANPLPSFQLPHSSLPGLNTFDGPQNLLQTFVTGRPITRVGIHPWATDLNVHPCEVLQSIMPVSHALRVLQIEARVDERLLEMIGSEFVGLVRLILFCRKPGAKDVTCELLLTSLRHLVCLEHLRLHWKKSEDEQDFDLQNFYRTSRWQEGFTHPKAETLEWQWQNVLGWETVCGTLLHVLIDGVDWDRLDRADWVGNHRTVEWSSGKQCVRAPFRFSSDGRLLSTLVGDDSEE